MVTANGSWLPVVLLVGAATGCGGVGAASPIASEGAAVKAAWPAKFVNYATPATLVASTEKEYSSFSRLEPDGRRLLVTHGMRIVEHPDGSFQVASDLLPSKEGLGVVQLPPRLGGGFVYYTTTSRATTLWKAPDWHTSGLAYRRSFRVSIGFTCCGAGRRHRLRWTRRRKRCSNPRVYLRLPNIRRWRSRMPG